MPLDSYIIFYATPDANKKIEVVFEDETAWLTQKALAELFGVLVPAINKHLKNIFASGELVEDSVVSILETTAADGKSYKTRHYNLDAIAARINTEEDYESCLRFLVFLALLCLCTSMSITRPISM